MDMTIHAVAASRSYIEYRYNDTDDLKSIRRFLKRQLAPTSDTPYIYIEPIEGTFMRPAVTARLVRTGSGDRVQASRAAYEVDQALVITVFGTTRAETITLAEQTYRCFTEGGPDGAAYRIPMWEFTSGTANRLSRQMRITPATLQMGLEATDDEGKWSRPIECRMRSPRVRTAPSPPYIGAVEQQVSR